MVGTHHGMEKSQREGPSVTHWDLASIITLCWLLLFVCAKSPPQKNV